MVNSRATEQTDVIRRATDIVELVSGAVTLKRAGRQFRGLCPFHQEKTPSFNVCPERQIFKCFGCGAGGDVFKFIQLRESVSFLEARAILAAKAGIELSEVRSSGNGTDTGKADIERVNRWAAAWFQQKFASATGRAAAEYVQGRGILPETAKRAGLGFAPDSWSALFDAATAKAIPVALLLAAGLIKKRDTGSGYYDAFRNRLMFPITDGMDRIIAFGGRALGDDPAKYLNSPQTALFDKSRCLYGLSAAREGFRAKRRAVVVEGYLDCLMAQQAGFAEAVATLGTALTIEHVQVLRRYVDEVILLFDADSAGKRAGEQSLPLFFTSDLQVRMAQVPEGKDPAEFLEHHGPEALEAALTSAPGALESKWNQVMGRCRSDAPGSDRRRAIDEFLGLIAQSETFGACDPIQRGLLANQVGKLLGLSTEEVHRQLRAVARKVTAGHPVRGPVGNKPAVVADAATAAMRDLIEVLLNEPGYYDSIRGQFDPESAGDEDMRAIATEIARLCDEQGGFALAELTSRFESVETAGRIIALQSAGERGGNYAARVEGAVATLQRAREQRRLGLLMNEARGEESSDCSGLRAAAEAARRLNHFAARRHRTAAPIIVGASSGEPQVAE